MSDMVNRPWNRDARFVRDEHIVRHAIGRFVAAGKYIAVQGSVHRSGVGGWWLEYGLSEYGLLCDAIREASSEVLK